MTTPRHTAYRELLMRLAIHPQITSNYSANEDAYEFLQQPTLPRYVAVTTHGDFIYASRGADTLEATEILASEYVQDGIFDEMPLEIVDLDTNTTYEPIVEIRWQRAS